MLASFKQNKLVSSRVVSDCARIQLDSGKTVTIHMWEGIRSVYFFNNRSLRIFTGVDYPWFNSYVERRQKRCAMCTSSPSSFTPFSIPSINMWEGIRSVWLSGDGKREWYNKEFHEVHADAAVGKVPPGIKITACLDEMRPICSWQC